MASMPDFRHCYEANSDGHSTHIITDPYSQISTTVRYLPQMLLIA